MKILHVLRAPIGGLFRHVRDLSRGQNDLGHQVGIVCDSTTGGDYAEKLLNELRPICKLGVARRPISRMPGLGDLAGAKAVHLVAKEWDVDVLHGHGAKGGVYERLAGNKLGRKSFYTPHGGSLHHEANWAMHKVLMGTEKYLRSIGTGLCFVCDYERARFDRMIGIQGKPCTVVYNGLWDEEFQDPVVKADATDFLFVGEMRDYKGVDILINALSKIPGSTATLVGDGPSMDEYKALATSLGIEKAITFAGRVPMGEAVTRGRIMVLPSRFESFPYVVLETAASGLPLITSAVGGIPEVVPRSVICDPLNANNLAKQMAALKANPLAMKQVGAEYAAHIRKVCSAPEMTRKITDFYKSAVAA